MHAPNVGKSSNIMDGSYNEAEYYVDIFLMNPVKIFLRDFGAKPVDWNKNIHRITVVKIMRYQFTGKQNIQLLKFQHSNLDIRHELIME
jgi:hypothetical protein